MNKYNFDTDKVSFDIEEMVRAIENEYGRSIARIAKFKRVDLFKYKFSAIFTDFRLLEAEVETMPNFVDEGLMIQVEIRGDYY